VKLKRLLRSISGARVHGSKEVEITGVCSDSRRVAPGNLFVARKGLVTSGALYISHALDAGAIAIATDLHDPTLKVTQVISERNLEAELASSYHDHPCRELFTVGVTGTNGKTTTTLLIRHLLGRPCGLIGTIGYMAGRHQVAASRTTPDPCTLQRLLREMVREGCQAAALEVTSHALDQERVAQVEFDVGVFTNLSHDHLDYHGSMENYAATKKKLTAQCKRVVINADEPHFSGFLQGFSGDVLTFGKDADLFASEIDYSPKGTRFQLHYGDQTAEVSMPLVGSFNVSNALAAVGTCLFAGESLPTLAERLASAPLVPGRLQRVPHAAPYSTFVDYAHTPDALKEALTALRGLKPRRLIALFGCGGDRDRTKRPEMGQIAAELADSVIITSDNPRTEDPSSICSEVAQEGQQIIVDRREAIAAAQAMAQEGDIVLIAGKGHETEQIGPQGALPFSDLAVAQELT
jgi:UDP-N-acetylmuramoyl-L-alanyl-D-glutamate--2,6-diaminopimelate ligase